MFVNLHRRERENNYCLVQIVFVVIATEQKRKMYKKMISYAEKAVVFPTL